jgi:hypothetical protein
MDRPPGWADSLFAGRSRADKEADQDAMLKVMIVFGGALVLLLVGLHALFRMVGLQLGWWSAPVFVPLFVWLLGSAGLRRSLRPVELDELRWRERLAGAGMLLIVLWLVWPLWAGPALVTSTKGDILKTAAHRARLGSVAVYDPTGSLGCPEVSVGLTPLSRCGTWDGAVEVAAALLSPASADENVRHGEHFAIAARARLVPMERSADLKHVVEAFATALAKAVPNLSHEERAETTRHFGDSLAVIAEHTPGEAIPTVRRIVEATERELGSDSST